MGSLYISLEQPDVALDYVRKSVALWFKPDNIPEDVDLDAIEAGKEADDSAPANAVGHQVAPLQPSH